MSFFQSLFPAHPEAETEILPSEGRLPPFEGAPDGVVAIKGNGVIHPHVLGGCDHVVDVALEAELGRMNPDHAQALIVVFVGPLTHVR